MARFTRSLNPKPYTLLPCTTLSLVLYMSSTLLSQAQQPVYLDETQPLEARVADALSRMTLEEKVAIIHAQSKFSSPGVPRLGIPELWCSDGPHGVRPEVMWDEWKAAGWSNDSCTAFPALTCLAATWNPEMARLYGVNVGQEARYRKKDVLLGPGVNILRTPLCGRNFEYMGEDPCLTSAMCVPYIQGLQSNGVAACVKHFAVNNHEVNRHTTNVVVDERTLYELYLPAFRAAVQKGGAWSIMGAYNLFQGQHNSHNKFLLVDVLRKQWHFDGAVISDWGGTHDTDEAIHNGLDLEYGSWTNGMTRGKSNAYDLYYMANPYLERIRKGEVGTEELDAKVSNVLRLLFRTVMNRQRPLGSLCSEAHNAAARKIADEGIVLLKNEGDLLPLDANKPLKITVVGENAIKMLTIGGGSSSLKAQHEVAPLEGIRNRFSNSTVTYCRGYVGAPHGEQDGVDVQDLSDDRDQATLTAEAVNAARQADVVIFVGGLNKAGQQDCEGNDRRALQLPYGQDKLIDELLKVNQRLVVVNISGNPVAMTWGAQVPAILQAWYLGSQAGNAVADILAGDVCPSGKLPMTFPAKLSDVAAHALGEYPGTPRNDGSHIVDCHYNEGIFVGYRYAEKHKVKPLFAFGHGLSYTQFTVDQATISAKTMPKDGTLTLTARVTNIGKRAGAEVVQLYVGDVKCSVPRPVKELRAFKKVELLPGQSQTVTFNLTPDDLAFYNASRHAFEVEPGEFVAYLATAADNVKASLRFNIQDK